MGCLLQFFLQVMYISDVLFFLLLQLLFQSTGLFLKEGLDLGVILVDGAFYFRLDLVVDLGGVGLLGIVRRCESTDDALRHLLLLPFTSRAFLELHLQQRYLLLKQCDSLVTLGLFRPHLLLQLCVAFLLFVQCLL